MTDRSLLWVVLNTRFIGHLNFAVNSCMYGSPSRNDVCFFRGGIWNPPKGDKNKKIRESFLRDRSDGRSLHWDVSNILFIGPLNFVANSCMYGNPSRKDECFFRGGIWNPRKGDRRRNDIGRKSRRLPRPCVILSAWHPPRRNRYLRRMAHWELLLPTNSLEIGPRLRKGIRRFRRELVMAPFPLRFAWA